MDNSMGKSEQNMSKTSLFILQSFETSHNTAHFQPFFIFSSNKTTE